MSLSSSSVLFSHTIIDQRGLSIPMQTEIRSSHSESSQIQNWSFRDRFSKWMILRAVHPMFQQRPEMWILIHCRKFVNKKKKSFSSLLFQYLSNTHRFAYSPESNTLVSIWVTWTVVDIDWRFRSSIQNWDDMNRKEYVWYSRTVVYLDVYISSVYRRDVTAIEIERERVGQWVRQALFSPLILMSSAVHFLDFEKRIILCLTFLCSAEVSTLYFLIKRFSDPTAYRVLPFWKDLGHE